MYALRKLRYWQLLLSCLFAGLMMGTAVRATVPQVTLVTAPILCPGPAEVAASWYRCTSGRPLVADETFGDLPNIFAVIALTTALYGLAFFAVGAVAKLAAGRMPEGADQHLFQASGPHLEAARERARGDERDRMRKEIEDRVAREIEAAHAEVAMLTGANLRGQGVPGQARVLSIASTGKTINMMPVCRVDLEVQGAAGPYRTSISQIIDQVTLPRVQPGMTVAVRIDPSNPMNVVVEI